MSHPLRGHSARSPCAAGLAVCLLLLAAGGGCHRLLLEAPDSRPAPAGNLPAKDPPAGGLQKGATAVPAATADRAVFCRGEWNQAVPPLPGETAASPYHWRHPALEDLLGRPAGQRPDLRLLLADKDPIVAGNAAIALARGGDPAVAPRLAATARTPQLKLSMRYAAVEALAFLPGAETLALLRELTDQYGQTKPGAGSPYLPEVHAELVRGLARQIDAGQEPRLSAALGSPAAEVRLEALHAWAAGHVGALPVAAADLRSTGDWRVRAAALQAMVARRHPQARQYLTEALRDTDFQVRTAAIAGLGILADPQAQATLRELMKDRIDGVRAEVVTALARAGAKDAVLDAAGDVSWRVRLRVAAALAAYPDRDGAAVATKFLDDQSAEVERRTVLALGQWPLEQGGPLLLAAMSKLSLLTRQTAAEQLASRWPPGVEYSADAPLLRRQEILQKLQTSFQQQFHLVDPQTLRRALAGQEPAAAVTPEQLARLQQLLQQQDFAALGQFGPRLPEALEQLAVDHHQVLPEAVYRQVLPQYQPVYETLARLASEVVAERRRAAEELVALAQKQPLPRLAMERLSRQVMAEADPLVWQSVLTVASDDSSDAAARLAAAAISHPADEVRRRACQYFIAHPNPAYAGVLLPALQDPSQAVVIGAARALAAVGRLDDRRPLRQLLRSDDEEIQLEAAVALTRLGDAKGVPAMERMTYSGDPKVRARAALAMGELGNASFVPTLVRLLDDHRGAVSRAALASLPKVAGRDVAESSDGVPPGTMEQIRRWKKWYEQGPRT